MSTSADKIRRNKGQSLSAPAPHAQGKEAPAPTLDNRPEAIAQRKRQAAANSSPQTMQLKALQETANKRLLAPYSAQAQRPGDNKTGLPDPLKSGIEHLSGISMDDVTVHYNSDRPAKLHAHAYAQGTDIYLGPGQEKHLPHEAWHVVQQKRKQVQPTLLMKAAAGPRDQVKVNDDAGLEKEADEMGAKAMAMAHAAEGQENKQLKSAPIHNPVAQRLVLQYGNARPIPTDAKNIAEAQDKERGREIAPQKIPGEVPEAVFKAMDDNEKIYIVGHGVAALGNSPALLEDGAGNELKGKELANVIAALKTGLEAQGKSMGAVKVEACMSALSRQTQKGNKKIKPSLLEDIQKRLAKHHKVKDVELQGNLGLSCGNEFEAEGVKNTSPENTEVALLIKVLDNLYRIESNDWDSKANKALKQDGLRIIDMQKEVLDAFDIAHKRTTSTAETMRGYLSAKQQNVDAHRDLSYVKTILGGYIRKDPS